MALTKHDLEWISHFLRKSSPVSNTDKEMLVRIVHRVESALEGKKNHATKAEKTEGKAA